MMWYDGTTTSVLINYANMIETEYSSGSQSTVLRLTAADNPPMVSRFRHALCVVCIVLNRETCKYFSTRWF